MDRLPEKYQVVMQRAKSICVGEENEYWSDIQSLLQSCADFMVSQINDEISAIKLTDVNHKSIKANTL